LLMSVLPKTGSGNVSRFGISLRLGILKDLPKPYGYSFLYKVRMPVESESYRLLANTDHRFSAGAHHSP
jgi:hypothetical protein